MSKFQKWRDADSDLRDGEERERREAERRRVELMERRHEEEVAGMRGEYVETIDSLRGEVKKRQSISGQSYLPTTLACFHPHLQSMPMMRPQI